MSFDKIRAALEIQLATLEHDEETWTEFAWENINYTPVQGTPYIRPKLIFNRNRGAGIGVDAPSRYDGVYLVDVLTVKGSGPQLAETLAGAILDLFPRGSTLTEDGIDVKIKFCEIPESGIETADWYLLPITIAWYCYV